MPYGIHKRCAEWNERLCSTCFKAVGNTGTGYNMILFKNLADVIDIDGMLYNIVCQTYDIIYDVEHKA